MRIGAVVLDLEGVYFEHGAKRFNELLMSYGHDQHTITKVYSQHHFMREYKKGRLSGDFFWNHVIKKLQLPETKETLLEKMVDQYEENLSLAAWLQQLRGEGIITAACSNTYADRIHALDKRFRFLRNFDITVFSYEPKVRVLKPHEHMFNVLTTRIGLPPQRIFITDDQPHNVVALQELGFLSVLYTSEHQAMNAYERMR